MFMDGCPAPHPLVRKNWNPAWQVWGLGEGAGMGPHLSRNPSRNQGQHVRDGERGEQRPDLLGKRLKF